ncbi:hypothetical protein F0U60_12895 [Archangium minus]|uniref:Uncharacterized protein n=1 Tax=Archangium minus TaxID=83450 RepID=A0ABY9WM87_9BACT|nr:hypothetical protein F0U60_12895 [Archangium minus]
MIARPLDLMGLTALSPEEVKALRRRPLLALDARQCQRMSVVDLFEAGPLLLTLTQASSEPDAQLIHKALFGGRPLPAPATGYSVLEAREVAALAPRLAALSPRKWGRQLEEWMAQQSSPKFDEVPFELAVECVQDCVRYFREHARKGNALLQWNAKWKGGPLYRPDAVLAVITGGTPRRMKALIQAFDRYVRRKGLLDEQRQLTPNEALSALLGSKRRRKYLELDSEIIPWLRPHVEPVA